MAEAEDEDEEEEVEGSFFYVNRDGFPLKEDVWDRMYEFASKNHPLGADLKRQVKQSVRSGTDIPIPSPPGPFPSSMGVAARLDQIQSYMSSLKYNHTGTQFFEIKKTRPISGLMETAKDMVRESLPIKCLEAVVLATYLTNDISGIVRFNISFKTLFEGGVYRHVVLGVYYNGKYGALGMSRRKDLMYKPLKYESLPSLVKEFLRCYRRYGHIVRKIKCGNKITKDPHSFEPIPWKGISLEVGKMKDSEMTRDLEHHSRDLRVKNPYEASPRMPVALPKHSQSTSLSQSLSVPARLSGLNSGHKRRSRSFVGSIADLKKSLVEDSSRSNSIGSISAVGKFGSTGSLVGSGAADAGLRRCRTIIVSHEELKSSSTGSSKLPEIKPETSEPSVVKTSAETSASNFSYKLRV